jgi:hypothetical protein
MEVSLTGSEDEEQQQKGESRGKMIQRHKREVKVPLLKGVMQQFFFWLNVSSCFFVPFSISFFVPACLWYSIKTGARKENSTTSSRCASQYEPIHDFPVCFSACLPAR